MISAHILLALCCYPCNVGFLIILQHVMPRYSHVIATGVFHIDLLGRDTFNKQHITSMLYSFSLTLLPLHPTHHNDHPYTPIDLMAVSDPTQVVHQGQLPVPGILNMMVYKTTSPKNEIKLISYKNFKAMSHVGLSWEVGRVDWSSVIVHSNSDGSMVDIFNQILIYLLDRHTHVVAKRIKKQVAPGSRLQYGC